MPTRIPADTQLPIYFAQSVAAATAIPIAGTAFAIVPQHSTWNDFTYYFTAILCVLQPQNVPSQISFKLMFEGAQRTETKIADLLATRSFAPLEEVQTPFCSLLSTADDYRVIVAQVGFEAAVTMLRRIGDAVVVKLEERDSQRLALIDSDAFHLGALRNESAYTAFRKGGRFLRPQPFPEITDAATSFTVRTQLPSANNEYHVAFDFAPDNLSRNRVAVLIGKNGSGKTQFLTSMIMGLRSDHASSETAYPITLSPPPIFSSLLVFSSVTSDVYPREIPPWLGVDYHYFSMTASTGESDRLTAALIDCLRDDGRIRFIPDTDALFPPTGRMGLLNQALEAIGLSSGLFLPLKIRQETYDFPEMAFDNGRSYFPLSRAPRMNEQRRLTLVNSVDWSQPPRVFGVGPQPRNLSSGELAMLRFAAQAAGSVERGCLFLFDEPETHLHPNFVSRFMTMLHTILAATGSIAIIATHSAFVVREVQRQSVHIFSLEGRAISVDPARLQTYGASIDSISQFIFRDTEISHQYEESLLSWIGSLGTDITIEQIRERFGRQMNSETLSYVASLLREKRE